MGLVVVFNGLIHNMSCLSNICIVKSRIIRSREFGILTLVDFDTCFFLLKKEEERNRSEAGVRVAFSHSYLSCFYIDS